MSLSFLSPTPHSGGHIAFNPSGSLLAIALGAKLYIRDSSTMEVVKIHVCVDKIERIEWSADSEYILCCMYKRATVQVFSIADPEWRCRINESVAGFVYASWAPDSRHILSMSDFQIQLTVWSLVEQRSYYIRRPKPAPGSYAFSPSGGLLAVLQRKEAKDYVGVYDCSNWTELSNFRSQTHDAATIYCMQEGSGIVVVDGVLNYKVLVYSLNGEVLSEIQPYERALGVKTTAINSNGSLLGLGSYDQVVRIITPCTWKVAYEYAHIHPREMHPGLKCPNMKMFVEVAGTGDKQLDGGWTNFSVQDGVVLTNNTTMDENNHGSRYVRRTLSALPFTRVDPRKPNPKLGVGMLVWSPDMRHLATRNDNMPTILWIWDTTSLGLRDVLVQLEPIRSARWSNQGTVLAFCTGSNRVYLWSTAGPSWIDVPIEGFQVLGVRWSPSNSQLILLGKDSFTAVDVPEESLTSANISNDELQEEIAQQDMRLLDENDSVNAGEQTTNIPVQSAI